MESGKPNLAGSVTLVGGKFLSVASRQRIRAPRLSRLAKYRNVLPIIFPIVETIVKQKIKDHLKRCASVNVERSELRYEIVQGLLR